MQKIFLKFSVSVIITAVFLFMPCPNLYAETASDIVEKLQQKYEGIMAVSADFTQEVFSKGFAKPQASGGKVYLKKPGKMKWIYSEGAKDALVSNGAVVWFYQSDLNQVVERPVGASASGISTDFLSGVGNIKKDFTPRLENGNSAVKIVELTPIAPQQGLKRLFLTIDAKTGIVVKTAVEDHYGNKTVVSLKNVKLNPSIKDSFFDYNAPKGASVLKQ